MAKPYSLDLRERVVARVVAGEPVRTVTKTFGVSVASAVSGRSGFARRGAPHPIRWAGAVNIYWSRSVAGY